MKRLYILPVSLLVLTLISGLVLSSVKVSADNTDVVDNIAITVPQSCTMSGDGMNSHTATINPGTYNSSIGLTTITAFCNDNQGFSIYAIGYTNEEEGNNVLTSSALGSSANISTSTATSGNNSAWAMKLAIPQSPTPTYPMTIQSDTEGSFSSFHTVPDDYTLVAKRTSSTDVGTGAEGSSLTTTYQTYISQTQPAGTYLGKVKYTMVHPNDAPAPVACNPNATTIAEAKCMQDFTGSGRDQIISSMTTGTQYSLKDKRDGKRYTITKLADGNVWMTQNLDLDLDSSRTYTNEDTDIGWNTTTDTYDTASWTPARSTYQATSSQTHEWCVGGSRNSERCLTNNTPESYDPGNLYWNTTVSDDGDWDTYYEACDFSTSTPTCDQSLNPISTYTLSTGTPQYHLGNYYNWTAAIAKNDSSNITTAGTLVEQSICSAGWTLPRSGSGEDSFQALWEEYGWDIDGYEFPNTSTAYTNPLYFNVGGSFSGVLGDVGSGVFFWSPVVLNSNDALAAFNDPYDGYAEWGGNFRFEGHSVRCVARPVAETVSN